MNQNVAERTSSRCFNFTVLYAAVVNEIGPKSPNTASCIFRLALSPPKTKDSSRLVLVSTYAGAAVIVVFVSAFVIYFLLRARNPSVVRRRDRELSNRTNTDTVWFSIDEIKAATHNFSQANLIGQGAFGTVYKGTLPDGQLIAVKRIRNCSAEGDLGCLNEVEIINKIRHPNLVPLRGCCIARDDLVRHRLFLIYNYMPNGSVHEYIFGGKSRQALSWLQRKNIVLGIAKGLAYLHSGVQPAIYHRDIKPTNVMLDDEMNARVSDFGLATIMTEEGGESHLTLDGYLAPEYVLYGQLTEKSDVYSFGVVLLEIMSGRKLLGTSLESASDYLITDWAWRLVKAKKVMEVVDDRIRDSGPVSIMTRFVAVGILCAHVMVAYRPTIVEALKMLEGDLEIPEIPDRPLSLTRQSLNREENNCGFFNFSTSATSSPISPTEMLR
jgi:serine/threonine protein kinase